MSKMPIITDTPNSEMKPMAAEMLKLMTGEVKRQHAAGGGERNPGERQQTFAH